MTKTQTSTSNISIPQEWQNRFNDIYQMGSSAASHPFERWGNEASDFVAPINAEQQRGITGVNQAAGSWQPGMAAATAATTAGMGAVNPDRLNIDRYMSPYIENVADTTAAQLNQQFQQAQSGQMGNAIESGAFGGDRAGIAAAALQGQQAMAMGSVMSNIYNQGYGQAADIAQGQQQLNYAADVANRERLMQGAAQQAALAGQGQQMGLAGAGAQLQAGGLQQQTEQAGITALINQFMQEKGYPFQIAQFLANLGGSLGSIVGSNTTQTTPRSWWGNRGGAVPAKADGGGVSGPYGAPVGSAPESEVASWVPPGFLPIGDLLIPDPNALTQASQTAADRLNAAANFGDSLTKLNRNFGHDGEVFDVMSSLGLGAAKAPDYADGGEVKAGLYPAAPNEKGYLQSILDSQSEAKKAAPQPQGPAGAAGGQSGGLGGLLMGVGSAASGLSTLLPILGLSDPRAKEGAQRIGYTDGGMPIHSFRYKGDPSGETHVGFMADEVAARRPDAVGVRPDGYMGVDYSRAPEFADGGAVGYMGGVLAAQPGAGGAVPPERGGMAGPKSGFLGGVFSPEMMNRLDAVLRAKGGRAGFYDGGAAGGRLPPEVEAALLRASAGVSPAATGTGGVSPRPPGADMGGLGEDADPRRWPNADTHTADMAGFGNDRRLSYTEQHPELDMAGLGSDTKTGAAGGPFPVAVGLSAAELPGPGRVIPSLDKNPVTPQRWTSDLGATIGATAVPSIGIGIGPGSGATSGTATLGTALPELARAAPPARPAGLGAAPAPAPAPAPALASGRPAPSPGLAGAPVSGTDHFNSFVIQRESNGQHFDAHGKPKMSSAGAVGISQMLPSTGPEAARLAGVQWNEYAFYNNPEYNRTLGEAYYNNLLRKYGGDYVKADAAYNAGPGRVDEAVATAARNGGSYVDYLPPETRAYAAAGQAALGGGAPVTGGLSGAAQPTAMAAAAPGVAGAAPAGRKPYAERNALGQIVYNPETNKLDKNFLLSLLSGVGTMASSPSVNFGTSVLQGLGGAANTYAGLQKQAADIQNIEAQTRNVDVATEVSRFFTAGPNGAPMVIVPGVGPVLLTDFLSNPMYQKWGNPAEEAAVLAEAQRAAAGAPGTATFATPATADTGAFWAMPSVVDAMARENKGATMNWGNAQTASAELEKEASAASRAAYAAQTGLLRQAKSIAALVSPDAAISSGALGALQVQAVGYVNELLGAAGMPLISGPDDAQIAEKMAVLNSMSLGGGPGYQELVTLMTANPDIQKDPRANAAMMAGTLLRMRRDIDMYSNMQEWKTQPGNKTQTVLQQPAAFNEVYGQEYAIEEPALEALIYHGGTAPPGMTTTPIEAIALARSDSEAQDIIRAVLTANGYTGPIPDHLYRILRGG